MSGQCQRKRIFVGWGIVRFNCVLEKIFVAQQNIFHACSEDIDLIYHYADEQNLLNVFDTQVGLSFLGHGLQVSYQGALKLCLDIDIEKDQTRSDWLARPLSPQQLCYAAMMFYILQLATHIQEQLKQKGFTTMLLKIAVVSPKKLLVKHQLHCFIQM